MQYQQPPQMQQQQMPPQQQMGYPPQQQMGYPPQQPMQQPMYPPQQPMQQPMQTQNVTNTTVVVQGGGVTPDFHNARQPVNATCGKCNATCSTRFSSEISEKQWLFCLILFIVYFPLMCIPLCIEDMKQRKHKCGSCGHTLYKSG